MIKKISVLVSVLFLPFSQVNAQISPDAVSHVSLHGTNCMTANLAQGGLFSWNAKGLTNNFQAPLYIICPVPLNSMAIEAGANAFRVSGDWYLPPTYPSPVGPRCYLRVQGSGFGAPDPVFWFNDFNDASLAPNGSLGYNGFMSFDLSPIPYVQPDGSYDPLTAAHLLCLVPANSTFISYDVTYSAVPL